MDFKRILVAINSTDGRDAAFERALMLAQSSGAELHLLHAVPANQPFSFHAAERLKRMANLRQRADVFTIRPVDRQVRCCRIHGGTLPIQQRVRERSQHGLRMLPADHLQRAEAVCNIDRFVSDVPEVACAVPREDLGAREPNGLARLRLALL